MMRGDVLLSMATTKELETALGVRILRDGVSDEIMSQLDAATLKRCKRLARAYIKALPADDR